MLILMTWLCFDNVCIFVKLKKRQYGVNILSKIFSKRDYNKHMKLNFIITNKII